MNPLQIARFLTRSPLHGAIPGAVVGAGASALSRDENGNRGSLLRGAVRGAAVGAAGAGLGRSFRDTRLLNPSLTAGQAAGQTAKNLGQGIANFGRRQWYGLTGRGNADAIGMAGNTAAGRKAKLLEARFADEAKHMAPSALPAARTAHEAAVKSTLAQGAQAQRLQDAGVTSLPGLARGLRGPNRSAALRAMGSTITNGAGAAGVGVTVGLPVALNAPSLLKGDESAQGGMSMKQKMLGLGASIGTGAAVAGLPIIPQIAAGGLLDAGVQRLTSFRRKRMPIPSPAPETAGGVQ